MTRFERRFYGNDPYIQTALLQNRDVLEVYIDGIGRSKILTSGSPTGQEVKYTASTGRVDFPFTPEIGTRIVILYQNL